MRRRKLRRIRANFEQRRASEKAAESRTTVSLEAGGIARRQYGGATESQSYVVPYDENLLERARTQWQFGDWQSLVQLERDHLQHHPDRAKLALLAAAGHLQTSRTDKARQYIRMAQDWGVNKKLIVQILVGSLHNTLGRAYMAKRQDQRALSHFKEAIRIATPGANQKLLGEVRAVREAARLGLLPQAARLMDVQLAEIKKSVIAEAAQIKILETEIGLLHHELSLAQQRSQLYNPAGPTSTGALLFGTPEWKAQIKKKSVSQLGQDLWVLEKTNYKRGGFFVEFGATDGVLLSNTWLLEKEFGWKGICAEPNPTFYAQLKQNRDCIVTDDCIAGDSGRTVEFILADAYGGFREYASGDQHADKRNAYAEAGRVLSLKTISLHDFLIKHNAPKVIDYLSIDTEGSEFEILSEFPFEQWTVRLITVEHNFTPAREKIRRLLEAAGYRCIQSQWDDWYMRAEEFS